MKNHETNPTCLAIIGNGFDLAHDYKTSYLDFVESVEQDLFVKYKKYLGTYNCDSITAWYHFEEQVEQLTGKFYHSVMSKPKKMASAEYIIKEFNNDFMKVTHKLLEYLYIETKRIPLEKKKSIQNEIDAKTIGLNFNYTATSEHYLNEIFYVHGSTNEREIILGYDPTDPYCFASYENRRWYKQFLRERLAFVREMKENPSFDLDEVIYRELCEDFELVMKITNSNKGFEQEDIYKLKHAPYFQKYTSKRYSESILTQNNISLDKVSKILILGHSIKSDETYLSDIFDQCTNLKQVIIFSYKDEKENEFKEKEAFFKTYCTHVEKRRY